MFDQDQPGGDGDPHLQVDLPLGGYFAHGGDNVEAGVNGVGGVVLMRMGIPEIGEDAVPHQLREKAAPVTDDVRASLMIVVEDREEVFGIEGFGKRNGIDQIAEQHSQRTVLGFLGARRLPSFAAR